MNSIHTRGARYFPSLICGVTTIIRRTCKQSCSLELLLKYSIAARFSLCQALPDFYSAFVQLFSFLEQVKHDSSLGYLKPKHFSTI